jgi:membrane associated rhomboid family serine protease
MGIYDRDYYRREGPSFLGSFVERGMACKWLIGINVGVFILQMLSGPPGQEDDPFTRALWLNVDDVLHGQVWRLLTYAFLHSTSTPWHILWNMLFLWWFGSEVEDLYGPREFTLFYLASALFGGIFHVVFAGLGWISPLPVIGASGAVTTVLVLCAIHFPTKLIYVFMLFPVPIWLFVVVSVFLDFYAFVGRNGGGTAVDVHLAGALFAFIYYKQHWRLSGLWLDLRSWRRKRNRPSLRVFRGEEEAEPAPVIAPTAPLSLDDEQLEAKVDAILEKISRSGKESLTENERQLLLRASERIKRRRT